MSPTVYVLKKCLTCKMAVAVCIKNDEYSLREIFDTSFSNYLGQKQLMCHIQPSFSLLHMHLGPDSFDYNLTTRHAWNSYQTTCAGVWTLICHACTYHYLVSRA